MNSLSNDVLLPISTRNWTDHRISRDHDDSAGCLQPGRARKLIATCLGPLLIALATSLSFTAAIPTAAAQGVDQRFRQNLYRNIISDIRFEQDLAGYKSRYPFFDWTTDGCTVPREINAKAFYLPCVKHDFGYRNNRRVGLHNEETRLFVDRQLRKDMIAVCHRRTAPENTSTCLGLVNAAVAAVRLVGGRWW